MPIITTPDPRLREKSKKVSTLSGEVLDTIAEMRRLSVEWENEHPYELSAAMAAPQIGANLRIIIIRDNLNDKENQSFTALINPQVIRTDGKPIVDFEGCLSVPSIYGKVPRFPKVRIKALTEQGHEVRIRATGELARTLQHEIDHLDGILFIDHIKGQKDAFYQLNDHGDLVPLAYDKVVAMKSELFPEEGS